MKSEAEKIATNFHTALSGNVHGSRLIKYSAKALIRIYRTRYISICHKKLKEKKNSKRFL